MKKKVKAVAPYIYKGVLNFKNKPFEAWREMGLPTVKGWYPRVLHKLMFNVDVPTLWHGEARLVFVQPVSLYFDTFFTALTHEMIPFIWDCWPCYYDKTEKWLKRHNVKTAIFTARQEMEEIKRRIPELNVVWCPEAVDTSLYGEGKELKDRSIDLLEFGRGIDFNVNDRKCNVNDHENDAVFSKIKHVRTLVDGKFIYTEEQLRDAMGDAKVTICLPRSVTHPDMAEGVETLTQRYWEAMLPRMVIIGHSPQELIDLIGYNPVASPSPSSRGDVDYIDYVNYVLAHIEDYQELVNKNRETALKMGDWKERIGFCQKELILLGYNVKS
ncbi:MAG: hypothetical protein KBT34_04215 [Prevotella sp.]|nr:hypothetical protein [Candidatus Prevotella equi]